MKAIAHFVGWRKNANRLSVSRFRHWHPGKLPRWHLAGGGMEHLYKKRHLRDLYHQFPIYTLCRYNHALQQWCTFSIRLCGLWLTDELLLTSI